MAATKTYTCQLLALYLLAAAMGGQVDVEILRRLPDWVHAVLELEERAGEIAERYTFMTRAVTVGRGPELRQRAGVGAQADGDLLRGGRALFIGRPDARADRADRAVVPGFRFCAPGSYLAFDFGDARSAGGIEGRDADHFGRIESRSGGEARPFDSTAQYTAWRPPALAICILPIPYIVPAQLFAAHLAAMKGLNPDRPRTLQKVTRTL